MPLLRLRSDEQLVALFRAGHDAAFTVIHDRYRARLVAYARQMLGSSHDAEDALQDVFLRAYAGLRVDDRPIQLKAWLYRVAHNRCIDVLRRPRPAPVELADEAAVGLPDPVELAAGREDLRHLVADVQGLPGQQRSVLLMRELAGLSYAQLAEAHDVTVPAVKSLLVRARDGLVQARLARETSCEQVRAELCLADRGGPRVGAVARRHARDCPGCREYRVALHDTRREFAALAPVALGPLGVLLHALGLGGAGGGAAASGGAAAAGGGAAAAGGGGMAALGGGVVSATAAKVAVVVAAGAAVSAGGAIEVTHQLAARSPAPRAAAPAPVRAVAAVPRVVVRPLPRARPAAKPAAAEESAATATPVAAPDASATDLPLEATATAPIDNGSGGAIAPVDAADDTTGGSSTPAPAGGEATPAPAPAGSPPKAGATPEVPVPTAPGSGGVTPTAPPAAAPAG